MDKIIFSRSHAGGYEEALELWRNLKAKRAEFRRRGEVCPGQLQDDIAKAELNVCRLY